MSSIAGRLNDERHLDWLRTSLSLLYLKEGVTSFCGEKGVEFHDDVKEKVRRKSVSATVSTCSTCTNGDIVRVKASDKKNVTWRIDCNHNICDVWLDEILPYHKHYPCPNIPWTNSDPTSWPTDPWEVCKLFLPYGSESQRGPGDSDCQGLLSLMMQNSFFHTFIPTKALLQEINQVRNACMHSSDLRVDEADMRRSLNLMLTLLQEPQLANRPSCVEARRKIAQLRDNPLHLSMNNDLELQALQRTIVQVRSDVQQLQSSLNDVTSGQDNTAEEYRRMCEHVSQLERNIEEAKRVGQISRIEMSAIEARLGNIETHKTTQRPIQPLDIERIQWELIGEYEARQVPVYLLRSDRKIRLEDIYVEQRLQLKDPDGRQGSRNTSSTRSSVDFDFDDIPENEAEISEKCIASLEEVFYVDGKRVKNIYVSGNAGYGKSVFCSHLVKLWSTAHSEKHSRKLTPDEEVMAEFPLLFHVDLRDAMYEKGDQSLGEIAELIKKQLHLSQLGLSDYDLCKLLQADDQVLVLIDALDECKEDRLPRRGMYNKCTTLIASRPWKLEAVRCDPHYIIDKELEIVGLKKGSPELLAENLVRKLNKKWKKNRNSKDFIATMIQEGLEDFLNVPLLLTSMLHLWFDDKPFGHSQCELYKNSIHHQILTDITVKVLPEYFCQSELSFPICEMDTCACQRYGALLWKLSEFACNTLLGNVREKSLVLSHAQKEYHGLTHKEVDICLKLGILTQYKLLGNVSDYEPQKSVSFTHKTYQEWFAAVYLSAKLHRSDLGKLVCEAIHDLDGALELGQTFLFVCGLNSDVAADLHEIIMEKVASEPRIKEYRSALPVCTEDPLIETIQDVVVAGVVEAKKNRKATTALQLQDVSIYKWYKGKFSPDQILSCDTSQAKSVVIDGDEDRNIATWPISSCMEKMTMINMTNTPCEAFNDKFIATHLTSLEVGNVTITHGQVECLSSNLAKSQKLRQVAIRDIVCKTHQDNRQDCTIHLDLSKHKTMEHLTLRNGMYHHVGVILEVRLDHGMDRLKHVKLANVTMSHEQVVCLQGILESSGNLKKVDINKLTCSTHGYNKQKCNIKSFEFLLQTSNKRWKRTEEKV